MKATPTTSVSNEGAGAGTGPNLIQQQSEAVKVLHGLLTPQTSYSTIERGSGKAKVSARVSVGVQVSNLEDVERRKARSAGGETAPSPVSPFRSIPTPKRKRDVAEGTARAAYIVEGERLARGIEDELRCALIF